MDRHSNLARLLISIYFLFSILSCSIFSAVDHKDCYQSDRQLLDSEYGELTLSISHAKVPHSGGNPMLAIASDTLLVAANISTFTRGIKAYDLRGKYVWDWSSATPLILVADQNNVFEGDFEKITILNAESGNLVDEIPLPGIGNITSFYHTGDNIFVSGSSGRFAIYNFSSKVMAISQPDFTKRMLMKEDNILYWMGGGKVFAEEANTGNVIWATEINESLSNPVFTEGSIFIRTGDILLGGNLYAINRTNGNIEWKKNLHIISNVDVTDFGVYFLTMDGYLIVLDPQTGEEVAKLEFNSRPFALNYNSPELIGGYFVDANPEKGMIAASLGDSCQIMVIKIK